MNENDIKVKRALNNFFDNQLIPKLEGKELQNHMHNVLKPSIDLMKQDGLDPKLVVSTDDVRSDYEKLEGFLPKYRINAHVFVKPKQAINNIPFTIVLSKDNSFFQELV